MQEHLPGKTFNEMTLVYAGDARNNMGNSMLGSCGAYRSGFASGRAKGMLGRKLRWLRNAAPWHSKMAGILR